MKVSVLHYLGGRVNEDTRCMACKGRGQQVRRWSVVIEENNGRRILVTEVVHQVGNAIRPLVHQAGEYIFHELFGRGRLMLDVSRSRVVFRRGQPPATIKGIARIHDLLYLRDGMGGPPDAFRLFGTYIAIM